MFDLKRRRGRQALAAISGASLCGQTIRMQETSRSVPSGELNVLFHGRNTLITTL